MLAQVDPTILLPYLVGPGAAVVCLLIVGAALYRLTVVHVLPLAGSAVDRHLKQIDALIEGQRTEAAQTAKALASLDKTVRALERRIAQADGGTGWGPDGDGGSIARRPTVDGDGRIKP
ncbi:MAG: hypothetical protein EBR73_14110 [Rhodobacteraceae bacterium]|nr:hypothetical protein [Paracoccaceae bacterium]